MKVEELYCQSKDNQVGVTFQRQPFETEVDIFPEVSPLEEPGKASGTSQEAGEPVESSLTSVQMEEMVCRVVKHKGEEEFQPIPLKRLDSGPNSHRIQGAECGSERDINSERFRHMELLDEIDSGDVDEVKEDTNTKKNKKEGTLSRMKEKLKNIRGEKGEKDDDAKSATKSLSKIFQRVNPVGKASRESFSKVFHRIGDVLQRKEEDKEETRRNKTLSLGRKNDTVFGNQNKEL